MSDDLAFVVALFAGGIVVVMMCAEGGYQIGLHLHGRPERETESTVSTVSGSVLALLAFILAFTFGIAGNRYDARKQLVRDEANAVRTAWHRSDFLPVPDRTETKTLIQEYLRARVVAVQSADRERLLDSLSQVEPIQRRLWAIAVENARKDMNSDVAALYIEALNEVAAVHATRVAVGLQTRIPTGIWFALCGLTIMAMTVVGYQSGIAGSKRTKVLPLMAISFGLVIAMIGALDRPVDGLTVVPQQPLIDLLASMDERSEPLKAGTP